MSAHSGSTQPKRALFSKEFLDELRALTPMASLVGRRVKLTPSGKYHTGCCPFHDDKNPSLAVYSDHFHCFTCKARGDAIEFVTRTEDVAFPDAVARLASDAGLAMPDTFTPRARPHPSPLPQPAKPAGKHQAATYPYTDAAGALLFEVVRYEPKDFRQRRPDGRGGWAWNMAGVPLVPYRLPELLAAVQAEQTVFVAEGEKGADALDREGLAGTCSPGGAGKWRPEYAEHLTGARVVILPDNDDPGRAHAAAVAASLRGKACQVQVVELPGLPPKGDVADWIEAGGTAAELERLARAEPEPPLPLLWFEDIAPVLDAKDFVQGVLVEGGAAVVYGESNTGKTFWVTDLALHVATGKRWNDRRVDQGGVIYCALEGNRGFLNRVSAWRQDTLIPAGKTPFAAIPASLNLLDPDADTPRLIETVQAAAKRMGQPVKLLVIDTLSRAMAGGNENAPDDMGALVRSMDAIRAATGACVLFVHHSGKDAAKGARGHSLLRAAVDTEIEIRADEASGSATATLVKQRELAKGAAFGFRLETKVLGQNQHGEDVTTCLVQGEQAAVPARSGKKLTDDEQGWLRDLKDMFEDPRQAHQMVQPEPDMPLILCATRDATRDWLVQRGRIAVAPGVAPGGPFSNTERSRLRRGLERLVNKGKLKMSGEWVWLL